MCKEEKNIAIVHCSNFQIPLFCFFVDGITKDTVYLNYELAQMINGNVEIDFIFIEPKSSVGKLKLSDKYKKALIGYPVVGRDMDIFFMYHGRLCSKRVSSDEIGFIKNDTVFEKYEKKSIQDIYELPTNKHIEERILRLAKNGLKQNLLIVGESGTGKTYLLKCMERMILECRKLDLLRLIAEYESSNQDYINSFLEMENGILLIDDICILSKQGAIYLADKLQKLNEKNVLIIATSRLPPYSLNYAFQQIFQTSLHINSLSNIERRSIIQNLCTNVEISKENIDFIVKETSGVTQGELRSICKLVSSIIPFENSKFISIVKSISTSEKPLQLRHVGKSQRIAGYKSVVNDIRIFLRTAFSNEKSFQGMLNFKGILLHGPSGNGKSHIIRSLCEEFEVPFFVLEFDKVFSRYLGDSEKTIRDIFNSARFFAPSAIVIENLDAIGGQRNDQSAVGGRVLSTLLNEINGVTKQDKVIIIGTTNAIDLIDSALIRAGRFDRIIEIGYPTEEDRIEIIQMFREKTPVDKDISNELLAKITEGYSCSEIQSFFRYSALQALQNNENEVTMKYFNQGKERLEERRKITTIMQKQKSNNF